VEFHADRQNARVLSAMERCISCEPAHHKNKLYWDGAMADVTAHDPPRGGSYTSRNARREEARWLLREVSISTMKLLSNYR